MLVCVWPGQKLPEDRFSRDMAHLFSVTETIQEAVTVIYVMELSIKQIIARPEELDVLFLNVTYTIVPGSEHIVATTTCSANHVDTQGICGISYNYFMKEHKK